MERQPQKSRLTSFRLFLLYSFSFVLYFSYHPVVPLFSSASTNYELSLPLLWLVLFSLLCLKDFVRHIYYIYKTKRLLFYFFPLYASLSTFWSLNPLRAFFTSGILWCLIISVIGIVSLLSCFSKNQLTCLRKLFLASAVIISAICWLQCFLDVAGVSPSLTFLCRGCTSRTFGFPHPSGFAIEPQFMGNLLLVPTLYSFYLFLTNKNRKTYAFLSLFLLTTLFLIFSRGALYSFSLGLIALLIFTFIRPHPSTKTITQSRPPIKRLVGTGAICLISFVLCLSAQATFAKIVSKTTPSCAVSTVIAQLSLNLIPSSCQTQSPATTADAALTSASTSAPPTPDVASLSSDNSPVFSGYVAESTNIRLALNHHALSAAATSPTQLLFGSGLGSAGTLLFEQGKTTSKKEMIQNEYLSLLVELGLIGLISLAVSLAILATTLRCLAPRPLLIALALASAVSLLFFSGLPNALHLYLFPAFLAKHKSIVYQEIHHHRHRRHQHKISRT